MTRSRRSQLWIAITILVVGSAISLSIGLGQRSAEAVVIGEVVTVIVAAVRVAVGAGSSDIGAVLSNRVDERQALIRLKASRVCAVVATGGAVVACIVTAALHMVYWPYEVIYVAAGVAYLVSLWVYGADREMATPPSAPLPPHSTPMDPGAAHG